MNGDDIVKRIKTQRMEEVVTCMKSKFKGYNLLYATIKSRKGNKAW